MIAASFPSPVLQQAYADLAAYLEGELALVQQHGHDAPELVWVTQYVRLRYLEKRQVKEMARLWRCSVRTIQRRSKYWGMFIPIFVEKRAARLSREDGSQRQEVA